MAFLLLGFVACYTLYNALAKSGADVNSDYGELIAWGRPSEMGRSHPPMSGWIAKVWFSVFPRAEWAADLLAVTSVAVALWITWRLLDEWLDGEKRVVGLAMLTLVPLYTFHALVFNANTVMLPFWAAATLFFLRSVRNRRPLDAALAGAAAGCALLGKYWAVFLVAGFALAAMLDARRRQYFTSLAPWISIAAGGLVLAPHLIELVSGETTSLVFARTTTTGATALRLRSLIYVFELVGYICVPLMIFLATRPDAAALKDTVMPADADRRLAAALLWLPLMLPPLANLVLPARLTGLWTIPNWTLLPVVLLGSPLVRMPRRLAVWVMALALALPLAAVVAAPFVSIVTHLTGGVGDRVHYRALAGVLEARWHAATGREIPAIGGETGLVNGLAFYVKDPFEALPFYLKDREPVLPPRITERARLTRDGIILVCPDYEPICVRSIEAIGNQNGGRRDEIVLTRGHLGIPGQPRRYIVVTILPSG